MKPSQAMVLTLVYLRHNMAHAVGGEVFGVRADTSENTFHEGVFVRRDSCPANRWDAEKQWKKGVPRWTPDAVERALIDRCESLVRRPRLPARQQRVDAGKKKRPTLKTQVLNDARGEMLDSDPGHRGPTADKRRYEQRPVDEGYPQAAKPGGTWPTRGWPGWRCHTRSPKGNN